MLDSLSVHVWGSRLVRNRLACMHCAIRSRIADVLVVIKVAPETPQVIGFGRVVANFNCNALYNSEPIRLFETVNNRSYCLWFKRPYRFAVVKVRYN